MIVIDSLKKFNIIFNKKQKRHIIIIVLMMFIGAMLETVGVGLMLPLMNAIIDESFFTENSYVVMFSSWLNITSANDFIVLVLACIIFIFLLKDGYNIFQNFVQQRFMCRSRTSTQKMLMESVLKRPYSFYLNSNTAKMSQEISGDVTITFNMLLYIMTFFSEACVCVILCLVLFIIVDIKMTLFVGAILLVEMLLIFKVFKPQLTRLGVVQREKGQIMNKWLLEAIGGVKEAKVCQKEDYFISNYSKAALAVAKNETKQRVFECTPRAIIEGGTISAVLLYMIIVLRSGSQITALIPQFTAFALAAVRLLPAANRVSSYINNMAYCVPYLDNTVNNYQEAKRIEEEMAELAVQLKEEQKIETNEITLNTSCGMKNVTFAYDGADGNILVDAEMEVPAGKSIGIVGPSGSGKTTAVDIILGLLQPQAGYVYSDGVDIRTNYKSWLDRVNYIPQSIYLTDMSIASNVAFGESDEELDEAKVWAALDEAMLGDFVRSLPEGLHTEVGDRGMRLSGGQRQRIGIARALFTNPDILIFDEATSALDNETEAAIMESINALHGKKTMIIIAHRLTTIEDCDIIYRVENGKITRER